MTDFADGIYFDMDADIYHKIKRASCSFLQKMLISPADAWAGSWMDPNRPTDDEDATAAQIFGRFTHTARLEPEKLKSLYVRKLEKDDIRRPGALYTDAEISAELEKKGLPKTVKGEKVLDKAYRLFDAGYTGPIWHIFLDAWEEEREGRQPISGAGWDETLRDAERLRMVPQVAELMQGGAAEVSILWTCAATGIKMKARLDYLRATDWTDLKTFVNQQGKHLNQMIADSFRYNRYYIQAALYREAVEMVRTSDALPVHGTAAQEALVAAIRDQQRLDCWYVFQQKGGVPNILARKVSLVEKMSDDAVEEMVADGAHEDKILAARRAADMGTLMKTGLYEKALRDIMRAKRDFVAYSEVYEPGQPWLPLQPMGVIDDGDFNQYWLEDRA